MKYLIIAMPGCGNLGDDLISTLLQKKIIAQDPNAEIGVLCGEFSEFTCFPNVKKLLVPRNIPSKYWNRKTQIISFIRGCDRIFIGGGGLLQDSHSIFTIHKYLHWLYYATCQVDCIGVGVGPINHSFNKKYLKRVLNRPGVSIQVRDQESFNYLVQMRMTNVHLGCDVVEGSELNLSTKEHEGTVLGCSIRKWVDVNKGKIVDLINSQVIEKSITNVNFFVFEHSAASSEEFDFLTDISKSVNCSNTIYVYGKDLDFFDKMRESDFAIASRYHANIIWQKIGVPVMPIPYAPKVYSLYSKCGIKLLPIDSDGFSRKFIKINVSESFEISTPYSNNTISFTMLEKLSNRLFEYWRFVQSIMYSVYYRL